MKAVIASILMAGSTSIAMAQTAPAGPGGASTSHQRDVTGGTDQESMPPTGGTSPSDASSPHQRDAMKNSTTGPFSDNDFVAKAAMAGMTEVQASQLAQQKAQSDAVKKFAQQMVADHTKANSELKTIAANQNIAIPAQLDAEHDFT